MKKKIQKYLSGEREGFSLVELIIVIAIMAILIGVIALAVIPNIGRSRESKDLQTLDNILSSTNTAIANLKVNAEGQFTISSAGAYSATANSVGDKVKAEVEKELGTIKLGAGCNSGETITVKWVIKTGGAAEITVGTGKPCTYTKDDSGNAQVMTVSNKAA